MQLAPRGSGGGLKRGWPAKASIKDFTFILNGS